LSPGNSIGTLTVTGNLVQNGGTYLVQANAAGLSDRVNVGGSANLNGGTVQVQAQPGTYARKTTYTILNAAGGVNGSFSGVTSNLAFLTPSLSYDANNVYLLLAQSSSAFAAGAQTANQYAVGAALDQANSSAAGDFNTVLNALSALSTAQGPAALNAISGQNYSGFSSSMLQGSQLFMESFLAQAGGGSRRNSKVALAQACELACDEPLPSRWGAWGGPLGGTGTIAGNANSGAFTYSVAGFAAGLDREFDDTLRAGITIGYTGGSQWVSGFSGQGLSNTVLAGLYGTWMHGPAYLDGLAGYAYSANQMSRSIVIPGLTARTAQGSTGANQIYGELEGGWRFDIGGAADAFVTPFARLQAYTAMQNGFNESGAQSLDLNVAAQTTNSLRSVLGAQLGGAMDMGWRDKLNAQFRLGWSHEYANVDRPVTASFAGAPTIPFTAFGASPQRDGVVVGFSAQTAIADAASLYLRYEGDISGPDSTHALTAGVRIAW
ncbi:MAG: autotransporter outer membrane beta-barrel domain-containing protein, partial [Alphaproteobacteria bacterium]|nr:autotransporter outer membrane beta-barrel domain-containing protein [Alphaproteobacteria bacterium]